MVCGRLRVKLARVKAHSDIVERKMEVTLTEDTTTHPQSLIVNTLQLISWPREGLPHPKSTILLMEKLTGALMKSTTKKTVVMCRSVCSMLECLHASLSNLSPSPSDGVVRSGTFLCIHSQLERLKTEGVVDVFQAIKSARIQRPGVIPNTVCCYSSGNEVFVDLFLSL